MGATTGNHDAVSVSSPVAASSLSFASDTGANMHLDDPDAMTPEQRLAEVAAILAKGYLRIRCPEISPETPRSNDKGLDVSGDSERPCDRLTDGDRKESRI